MLPVVSGCTDRSYARRLSGVRIVERRVTTTNMVSYVRPQNDECRILCIFKCKTRLEFPDRLLMKRWTIVRPH